MSQSLSFMAHAKIGSVGKGIHMHSNLCFVGWVLNILLQHPELICYYFFKMNLDANPNPLLLVIGWSLPMQRVQAVIPQPPRGPICPNHSITSGWNVSGTEFQPGLPPPAVRLLPLT
jgi:hypothetical protein